MSTKQHPADGKIYDEATHQWVDVPAPAPVTPPTTPSIKAKE